MAYKNFTNCTEEEYKNIIYSQDDINRIRIWFNNVELLDADEYCISLSSTNRILPNDGSKRFSLNNFVSKGLELVLRDIPSETIIKDQVKISIGTLVDDTDENNLIYEDVPIGIFNIQDTPTNDNNKITIKLRDNRVKFDFNYNAKPLIDKNGGKATYEQILNDICNQAGVVNKVGKFNGSNIEVSIYDNTIKATTYVYNILEQAGLIPTIDRDGSLIGVNLDSTIETTNIENVKVLEEVNNVDLNDTTLKGKTTQDGTPTPTSPIEVETITGLQTIIASNKNLCYKSELQGTQNIRFYFRKVTQKNIVCSFTVNEALKNNSLYLIVDGTGYGIISFLTVSANTKAIATITLTDAQIAAIQGGTEMWLLLYKSGASFVVPDDAQIELGSTATDYVEHKEVANEINLGKNLAEITRENHSGNVSVTHNNNEFQLTWTGGFNVYLQNIVSNLASSKTYTVSFKHKGESLDLRNGSATVQTIRTGTHADYTLCSATITNITKFEFHFIRSSGTTSTAYIKDFQIEEGTATSYSPYFTPIELCDIGNYQDKIYRTSGKWYLHKEIGKVVLDGSENWTKVGANNNGYRFRTNISDIQKLVTSVGYSNYFTNDGDSYSKQGISGATNTQIYIRWDSLFTEVSDLTTWLSTHNTEVIYVLETPTDTEITDTTLLSQLENIRLLDGYNYIVSSLPIEIEYYKKKETYKIPLDIVEKYEVGTPYQIERVVYESGIVKYETSNDETLDTLYLDSSNPYITSQEQVDKIYNMLCNFNIDSVTTGNILGNPALDPYDIIEVYGYYEDDEEGNPIFVDDESIIVFKTLANNTYTYNGVNKNVFDTQIGLEQRTENTSINSQSTFKRWARTEIDNVNVAIKQTVGKIDEVEVTVYGEYELTKDTTYQEDKTYYVFDGTNYIEFTDYEVGDTIPANTIYERDETSSLEQRMQQAEQTLTEQGLTLEIKTSKIDDDGNTTSFKTTNYTLDENGFEIDDGSGYKSLSTTTGQYYYDNDTMVGKYTKDIAVHKDLALYGKYYYGIDESVDVENFSKDDAMFMAQMYEAQWQDENNTTQTETGLGHFWNGD